jgi:hypothetical protein
MAGAPLGNKNAAKAKVWHAAIMRALDKRGSGDRMAALDELAGKLLDLVATGDLQALKEFGDRLDGKPAQAIIGGGEDDPAIKTVSEILIRAVDAASDRPSTEG